jgi:DtxR family Mn-dependent transcriptional regulator
MNKEDKVLEFLYYWNRPISSGILCKELNYKHSTLNSVLSRLVERGLVEWEKYSQIRLTEDGIETAAHLSNHHFIIEKFFIEHLSLSKEVAHKEAVKLAPHIDCVIIDAICQKLGVSHEEINKQFCSQRDYL